MRMRFREVRNPERKIESMERREDEGYRRIKPDEPCDPDEAREFFDMLFSNEIEELPDEFELNI